VAANSNGNHLLTERPYRFLDSQTDYSYLKDNLTGDDLEKKCGRAARGYRKKRRGD
jgi:hypothetical protein